MECNICKHDKHGHFYRITGHKVGEIVELCEACAKSYTETCKHGNAITLKDGMFITDYAYKGGCGCGLVSEKHYQKDTDQLSAEHERIAEYNATPQGKAQAMARDVAASLNKGHTTGWSR